MLPAADLIAEIATSLTALNLGPDTTAAVLGAVVAPLLRSLGAPGSPDPDPESKRPRRRGGRPRSRGATRRRRYKRLAQRSSEARERARAALQANPGKTVSAVAEIAKVSRGTVVNAAADLARAARRKPRKTALATPSNAAPPTERRERAKRFLRDALARGPRSVSDVEEAAAKAHVELPALTQARGDLGVVTSRANTGGAHAVQWSLPG